MSSAFPTAGVQYEDMIGRSAIDWNDPESFKFLKSKGIDTDKYLLISLTLYFEKVEFEQDVPESIPLSIYTVDKDRLSGKTVPEYLEINKKLPISQFNLVANIGELFISIKRLSISLYRKNLNIDETSFDIIEEIELD